MKWLFLVAMVACGPPSKPPAGPTGGTTAGTTAGTGPASGARSTSPACDAVRAKVEQLYRAAARDRDPARVNELVADNTTMVMNDCVKAPDQAPACITAATTVHELEARCLVPIDDEGTEGDKLAR
jgi:hypothetical protein